MTQRTHRAGEAIPARRIGPEHHPSQQDFLERHSGLGTRVLYRVLTLLDRR